MKTLAISHATCSTSADLGVKGIVAFTESGSTARAVSTYRPGALDHRRYPERTDLQPPDHVLGRKADSGCKAPVRPALSCTSLSEKAAVTDARSARWRRHHHHRRHAGRPGQLHQHPACSRTDRAVLCTVRSGLTKVAYVFQTLAASHCRPHCWPLVVGARNGRLCIGSVRLPR
ncbi:MAG: pyruvate kinase alpha/beta domain-containing protein [Butyricicoccaceae bacterium]